MITPMHTKLLHKYLLPTNATSYIINYYYYNLLHTYRGDAYPREEGIVVIMKGPNYFGIALPQEN